MTTIDHRILIPAAPDVVWDYISDITRNPDWQIDCREVIFLTSKREGPGLRWRYSTPGNHEYVVAVTAWYNGFGYEYYFVDGTPFRDNRGRLRLQEIPEGTIVQWTFTYELGGLLGGMRGSLGMNRKLDQTIAESLKKLWQRLKQSAAGQPLEAKSLMREAPDVEARSAYQPRHPTVMSFEQEEAMNAASKAALDTAPDARFARSFDPVHEPPISEDDGQRISVIAEPPVEESDTRPRQPVAADTAPSLERALSTDVPASAIPPDLDGEPEFLRELVDLSRFEPPRTLEDTQPRRPVPTPVDAAPAPDAPAPNAPVSETFAPDAAAESEAALPPGEDTEPLAFRAPEALPDAMIAVEIEDEDSAVDLVTDDIDAEAADEEAFTLPASPLDEATGEAEAADTTEPVQTEQPTQPALEAVEPPAPPPIPEPSRVSGDSASIWEIFGVPRPSETGSMPAVTVEPEASAEAEAEAAAEVPAAPVVRAERIVLPLASSRSGLRLALRRRRARVRRP